MLYEKDCAINIKRARNPRHCQVSSEVFRRKSTRINKLNRERSGNMYNNNELDVQKCKDAKIDQLFKFGTRARHDAETFS